MTELHHPTPKSKSDTVDVIVVGAGHAGCEAALASARMGSKTLLLSMNLDSVAQMSCNPAIGGLAKGHMVCEIDSLGGEMGIHTDRTGIQFRMLNRSKGPAVWAPRAQCDKKQYQWLMKHTLEKEPNLRLMQAEVRELLVADNRIHGVVTSVGTTHYSKCVILSTGTFLNGLLHIGDASFGGGRAGEKPSVGLSGVLKDLGFEVLRLKTGTPARLNAKSIDFSRTQPQPGDLSPTPFSSRTKKIAQEQVPCHLTYTNGRTHQIIRENLHRSPLFSGKIKSIGPRYCPSVESKIVRFPDKEQHQLHLEPEGKNTNEIYVNGLSTSLPHDVQIDVIHSIQGLENAEVMRFGYAVEYDIINPQQLKASLESKKIRNLFLAGQINGTSGYEEAAAQGLMAGINAVLNIRNQEPFVLGRNEAYIGVLIDDLVTKGTAEPYRMFTSRAEFRLLLRMDNVEARLKGYGYKYGLISKEDFSTYSTKRDLFVQNYDRMKTVRHNGNSLYKHIKKPEVSISEATNEVCNQGLPSDVSQQIAIEIKYEGYIQREISLLNRMKNLDTKKIPEAMNFLVLDGIRMEAREKLDQIRPVSLGQASRISGISPCDLSMLMVHIEKSKKDLD